jgi:hypothetical protein
MKKIVKVDLYIKWEDGLEEEISTRLPDGINSDLENYFDSLEEERHEDDSDFVTCPQCEHVVSYSGLIGETTDDCPCCGKPVLEKVKDA